MLTSSVGRQGDRDGYHHDRPTECWENVAAESISGRRVHPRVCSLSNQKRCAGVPARSLCPISRQRDPPLTMIFLHSSIPTVGFNMKRVQKGHVTLKCWDLGGQPRFRSMWERYCRGVNAIVFIVDSADREALPVAKDELHLLFEKPVLEGIPLLVLGNKSDLDEKLSVDELIDALDLKSISHREVSCYGISAKEETNLDAVLQWLVARASK
ncbi:uncharacterized protein BP5553_04380 [Venustampulla echinocandica]|uniref:P-loop containing nucleoside triphosphate hydrolase n=1 Tax=Venustampulla echinocandica TaxID=2656787 RepID=A0A370TN52_9HELO|nr:uncharacterized protein BP5553_04380 [Venustampulla echinocandica]RDL36947.1 hypothetical protein BP5553_04380 [Venustampulla echinocandica]